MDSGELLIKTRTGTLPAVLVSALLTLAVAVAVLRFLPLKGAGVGGAAALLGYILFRVLYPAVESQLPAKSGGAGTWRVTEETLYLNEKAIPRSEIRQIYCWPNRNALGQSGAGWTVNIETSRGRHHVLRSLTKGDDAARSEEQLRAMVTALGFERSWKAVG